MRYNEAYEKYQDNDNVSILIETEDGIKALSAHNFIGGVCDCCLSIIEKEDTSVIRIVNIETMEVLYDRENK